MTNAKRETKNDRRAHAREEARAMREKQKSVERRRRFFIQGGIGIVVIAVAVIVTLVIVNNNANSVVAAASAAGPKNMLSDGILFHGVGGNTTAIKTAGIKKSGKPVLTDTKKLTGTANIVEYIDLQCPFCQEFVETNLAQEDKWVAAGKATLEIHPIAFLDASSQGTRYSSRAANAVACVANFDPGDFLAVIKTMYKNQPAEQTTGLSNSKILSLLSGAGANSKQVVGCVNGESFKQWVTATTARVENGTFVGVATTPEAFPGTPAVFVNGAPYTGSLTSASEFANFVNTQQPGTTD